MIVDACSVYEISLPIDANRKVTAIARKSKLALATRCIYNEFLVQGLWLRDHAMMMASQH